MSARRAINVQNFSGGWNCRDAPSELADNESPDCLNVTFDERGGVVKRLGYTKLTTTPLPAAIKTIFWWPTLSLTMVQAGAKIYKTTDFITFTELHTFSTADRVGMSDFQQTLVVAHPVDGTFTYDGATAATFLIAPTFGSATKGNCCATWQNRVYVCGVGTTVFWCKEGTPTDWDTGGTTDESAGFVQIREQDGDTVVALGVGQGFNPLAQGGLLAFKRHSVHRINSSAGSNAGEYITLSNMVGAASAEAVTTSRTGHICFMGEDGIYVTDGVKQPVLMSRKIELLFRPEQLNFAAMDKVTAVPYKDRVLFSFPRGSSTSNNFTIEFHPDLGWFAPHNFGFSSMSEEVGTQARVLGGDPLVGAIYDVFKGWADNGADIACRWQSKWFTPDFNIKCRFRRARMEARGLFSTFVKFDYQLGQGELFPTDLTQGIATWNDPADTWNEDGLLWGPPAYETYIDMYSLGVGRAISLQIIEQSQTAAVGPPLLGDGFATQVGSMALYGVRFDLYPLGLA